MEKSLRVAIVDDLTEDSQRLADYLEQFQRGAQYGDQNGRVQRQL